MKIAKNQLESRIGQVQRLPSSSGYGSRPAYVAIMPSTFMSGANIAMINRSINLLVLFVIAVVFLILAKGLHSAWNTTPSWDKEWKDKAGLHPSHSAEKILAAIKNATVANEYADAKRLEQILEQSYEPTGKVLVHINPAELYDIMLMGFAALALLVVPLSINYVRHDKLRLWNHCT